MNMHRRSALRTLVVGFIVVLALASAGCRTNMGVGVSIPIGGGWRGAYGGLSMGVGIPIR
jgi:predicted small secreted protein